MIFYTLVDVFRWYNAFAAQVRCCLAVMMRDMIDTTKVHTPSAGLKGKRSAGMAAATLNV